MPNNQAGSGRDTAAIVAALRAEIAEGERTGRPPHELAADRELLAQMLASDARWQEGAAVARRERDARWAACQERWQRLAQYWCREFARLAPQRALDEVEYRRKAVAIVTQLAVTLGISREEATDLLQQAE